MGGPAVAWILLVMAGLFEVAFTTFLRFADGFRNLWPTLGFLASATLSFFFLERAARAIPIGLAYAVWVGIGAVGTILVGRLFFAEPLSPAQLALVAVLLAAIVGLRLVTPA
ncbi:MAG: DMT family transporter [Thermaurantiacus tibetensis]|uniref:DMT family transporter n=1 Tax=Thermaurantiacus tibetensis TaxID=2759035 RepID=UPI00188E7A64|nr:multidrug efflux SMR transporter [Thermaurantiacus tibetensis]